MQSLLAASSVSSVVPSTDSQYSLCNCFTYHHTLELFCYSVRDGKKVLQKMAELVVIEGVVPVVTEGVVPVAKWTLTSI